MPPTGAVAHVLVWVEGCERPIYACPVALPAAHGTLSTSPAVLAVNLVTLWRLVASLALLSPSTTPITASNIASAPATTATRDNSRCPATQLVRLAHGLHCAVARVPPPPSPEPHAGSGSAAGAYAVAAVAARAPTGVNTSGETDDGAAAVLGWLAQSVLAALHPGHTWAASIAAPPHTQDAANSQLVTEPLQAYAAAQAAAAREAAAAQEHYGVREVLADGSAGGPAAPATTLAAVLAEVEKRHGTAATGGGLPLVSATVQAALHRWWTPFSARPDVDCGRGVGGAATATDGEADRTLVTLAGLFAVPSTAPPRGADSPGGVAVYACQPPCHPALRLLADCCGRHAAHLRLAEPPTDAVPLAVLPLTACTALVAACVGCVPHANTVALYEAALVHRDGAGVVARHTDFYVASASLRAVRLRGTVWHPAVLHDVWA